MMQADREDRFAPGKLWSLLDMLKFNATRYLNLGALIADMSGYFDLHKNSKTEEEKSRHERELKADLSKVFQLAKELGLSNSAQLIEPRLDKLPQTESEYELLMECLYNELNGRLFLYVPAHRSEFYESNLLLSDATKAAFPIAAGEIRLAGNCYATGSPTACAYHCMGRVP
ncbi:MAG: hypothetical protein K2Z25_05125 [Beijerinckiaceae bacterium]|nr:hypothetical protein [Beijerinckiaceae bacterium]